MKRGESNFVARQKTCRVRCLRSLTVALVAVAGAVATQHAVGEIILRSPEVSAGVDARASRAVMGEVVESDTGTDSRSDPGTVGAAASVSGASATSGGSVSATVTANPAADTLEIIAAGSTSLFARRNAPTQNNISFSTASGSSNFRQTFDLTERSYEYTVIADTEVSVTQTPAGSRAQARIRLGSLFEQRIDERGFSFSTGSLSGVLAPGQYTVSANAGGSYDIGQADATFVLSLELTSASRWIDPAGGTFRVPDNWEAPIVPGANDVAVFDLPGTYTVTLDQDVTTRRLRANGAGVNVDFDLNGSMYRVDEMRIGGLPGDSVSISFGDSSPPVLSALDGAVGAAPPPDPVQVLVNELLTVDQGGTANARIHYSTPRIDVKNGGRVNVRTGSGRLTVNQFFLGEKGIGLLNVSGGGELVTENAILGRGGSGSGSTLAVIEGLESSWESRNVVVGSNANAVLTIRDRALLKPIHTLVGVDPGSRGLLEIDNAVFAQQTGGGVTVGLRGDGIFEIRNGGFVDSEHLTIGESATSSGRVSVESSGELRISGPFEVSVQNSGGSARLIVDGGSVERTSSAGSTVVAPRGVIEVRNGRFHESHKLNVNGTLAIDSSLGSVSVGSRMDVPGRLTVTSGGILQGNGVIAGKVVVRPGGVNQFGGTVRPGTSPGTLTIDGDYEQTGGLLGIELTGTAAGQFDVLSVTGNTTIGGELLLEFIDGFAPRQGDLFNFIDTDGAVSGAFDEIKIRNLMPGFQFDLRGDGGGLTMVALSDGAFVQESTNWNIDTNGNWSSAAHWTVGVPNAPGAAAVFGSKITAPRTVTADVPITVGRIDFDNDHAYTVDGSQTITLDTKSLNEQINVTSGSHTIGAPLTLADNTVISIAPAASNLSITGALSASAVNLTKAGAGTLTVNSIRASGLSIDAGTVAVTSNGTPASTSVLGALLIAGGATPTAKLDLNNNAVIVDYPAAGPNPAADIRTHIVAGRGGTDLLGTWDGQGITSSTAAADPSSFSVGFANNADLPLGAYTNFRGEAVDDSTVLVRTTLIGDANLDGIVGDEDVTIVGATFGMTSGATWALGDFTYDGAVDDADVTLVSALYDPTATPIPAPVAAAAGTIAAVPEPATWLLALGGLVMGLRAGHRVRFVKH